MNQLKVSEKWIVSGRVQKVGFRYYAMRKARRHLIKGAARNLSDGRVEIIVIGIRNNLEFFLEEIKKGPPFSVVAQVERESMIIEVTDFSQYDVIF